MPASPMLERARLYRARLFAPVWPSHPRIRMNAFSRMSNSFSPARDLACDCRRMVVELASCGGTMLSQVLSLLLFWPVVSAQAHTFDFRTRPDPDVRYTLAICARPSPDSAGGIPAHAFLVWREAGEHGERVTKAVGYAANEGLKAVMASVASSMTNSSQLTQGTSIPAVRLCLELLVDKREFAAAENLTRPFFKHVGSLETEPTSAVVRSLGQEEASGLIAEIAVRFSNRGLYVPARRPGELPLAYVRRLIDANGSR
jgi:hypothetical protein